MSLHRENPAAGNGGAFGKHTLAGDAAEVTAKTPNRQPLVIERGGLIRTATLAELRRLARLGLIGGAA